MRLFIVTADLTDIAELVVATSPLAAAKAVAEKYDRKDAVVFRVHGYFFEEGVDHGVLTTADALCGMYQAEYDKDADRIYVNEIA